MSPLKLAAGAVAAAALLASCSSAPEPRAPAEPAAGAPETGAAAGLAPASACWAAVTDEAPPERAVVVFTTAWSGPGRQLTEILQNELGEEADHWALWSVDLEGVEGSAQACAVEQIPTLIVFAAGQPRERLDGLVPAAEVVKFLRAARGLKDEQPAPEIALDGPPAES